MEYATKHRTAPSQRRRANPPKRQVMNLIHSGVLGGGVSAFGPSRSVSEQGSNMLPLRLSDSYPAFFLLIATTSNKNFLKVQKL